MNTEAIASIIGGAIVIAAAVIKFVPRRLSARDTFNGSTDKIVRILEKQTDILQAMQGDHKAQQLTLEAMFRDVNDIRRDVRGAE